MTEIYVQLLDEGTTTYRPTQGVERGDNVFCLLPTPGYDPEMEVWEFVPGSLVICEKVENDEGMFLLAKRLMVA